MSSSDSLAEAELPDINDRLVEPDTPYEIWDGEVVYVPPADPPHGERHRQLCSLIDAHTGPEFNSAADLLTRTSRIDDVAPDVSVYPAAPNPRTGRRQLEHLAFEIVSTQSLRRAGRKAAKLVRRGVRRVFAIDVERSRALEWSTETRGWRELDPAGRIEDPALAVPLPIATLIRDARPDNAVARALLDKHNPVLQQNRAEGREEGMAEGHARGMAEGHARGMAEGHAKGMAESRAEAMAKALMALLAARGIVVDTATRARILAERDAQQLDRWIVTAASCTQAAELFIDG
jgi:Uma2 family endonuclease